MSAERASTTGEQLGGFAPILDAWKQLRRHAGKCPQCSEVVAALRRGYSEPPRERLESLCEVGLDLAKAWVQACEDERARFRALRTPQILR